MLVGRVRRVHCILDAGLGAGVDVLDIVGVLGLQLIKLVYAILDRVDLPLYPLFACEGVHMTPETFLRLLFKRLAGGIGRLVVGTHRAG